MSVSTSTSRVNYVGDGVTTVFTAPFKFLLSTDLGVYLDNVDQTFGYVVTGAGGSSGTVTFAAAPAAGVLVTINREMPYTQDTVLATNGPFPAKSVETMADKDMLAVQQMVDSVARTLKFPVSETIVTDALPSASSRIGKFLGFDASGNPIALSGTGTDASLRTDLAAATGGTLVSVKASGSGAVARTITDAQLDIYSVFDRFSQAQRADVRARTKVLTVGAALTTAFAIAQAASAAPWLPAGTYNINDGITFPAAWVGCNIYGAGQKCTVLAKSANGDALPLTSASRGGIRGMTIDGTGMATGGGLVLSGASSGVFVVEDIEFKGFPGRGLYANFTNLVGATGYTFRNLLFNDNGITQATPQAEYRYCQDSNWYDIQYGETNIVAGPFSTYGCYLIGCQQGNYGPGNKHWSQTVGGKYEACDGTKFIGNRWEENRHEGAQFINCINNIFMGNNTHSNSLAISGSWPAVSWTTCAYQKLIGNQNGISFDGTTVCTYCFSIASDCNNFEVIGNTLPYSGIKPILWTRSADMVFKANSPAGFGIDQSTSWQQDAKCVGLSSATDQFFGTFGKSLTEDDVTQLVNKAAMAVTTFAIMSNVVVGTVTLTLMKNGLATGHVVTIASGTTSGNATVEVAFAQGDRYDWKGHSTSATLATVTLATTFDA